MTDPNSNTRTIVVVLALVAAFEIYGQELAGIQRKMK